MELSHSSSESGSLDALIAAQASQRAQAPFVLDARSSRSVTYAALCDDVAALRGRLSTWGIKRGDRVGLLLSDPLTFSTWFFAGLASGVWVAPLDPTVTSANLVHVDERASVLSLSAIISDRDGPEGTAIRWYDVTVATREGSTQGDSVVNTSEGGVLLSSSGTTGTPKVMALPLRQLLETAKLVASHNQLGVNDRGFNPLPLWHINAEVVGLLATFVAGSSLVLDDRFHRTGFWKIVSDFEVTWINAVPAIISRLVDLQLGETAPSAVRFIRSASAPLAPALFDRFEASTGIPVIQSYGMTEAASQICVNPLNGIRKSGSVGQAVGVEVRIASSDTEDTSTPRVGHIEIKGPTVITAYESAAYDDRFGAEGWLRTGDLGYFDEDNYLFIVGRSDDVINRGGEKIYPLEIENALTALEGVEAVAVIGEPDDVFGQVPVAFVKPEDPSVLSSLDDMKQLVQRIKASAAEVFPKAYRPAAVKLVHEFPSHATGKIQKGPLRKGDVVVAYEERL
jgi:acyl-CoA synthetase (AMP-forming)/AMP-acid ligase II